MLTQWWYTEGRERFLSDEGKGRLLTDLQARLRLTNREPTYTSFPEHVFFIWEEGIWDPISQPKKLFSLVLKSNYKINPHPKPQNSPGFVLQLDEASTQLYVVSTQKYKLCTGLAIGRPDSSFGVKSEWKLHVYGLLHKAFPQLYLF